MADSPKHPDNKAMEIDLSIIEANACVHTHGINTPEAREHRDNFEHELRCSQTEPDSKAMEIDLSTIEANAGILDDGLKRREAREEKDKFERELRFPQTKRRQTGFMQEIDISGITSKELPEEKIEVETYLSRFWILGLFSYTAFLVIIIWGTFGPIGYSAKFAFGWHDGYIALLSGWTPIFSVICMFPFSFTTQKYGLRFGMILASSLVTAATAVRCFTLNDTAFTYLASVAAILNGMGSSLTLSLPAMLAGTWFPKKERATATAVGALATQLGGAGMYLSPLIVRSPDSSLSTDDIKGDIQILMFVHLSMAVVGLVATLVYFPEKPPKPPSLSSTVQRTSYFKSILLIIKDPYAMMVVTTYIFSLAIPLSWISIMNFSLGCLGISQTDSMWIAIVACIVSPLVAFIVARVTDQFPGHLKLSIIGLLFGSSCFFFWFLLLTEGAITASIGQVFVAVVFAVSLQYSSVSLLIELCIELSYPCPESVVGGLLIFLMDTVSTIFLLLMMIPSDCFRWLSYALVASTSLVLIPMVFVKEVYKRSACDCEDKHQLEEKPSNVST